MRTVLTRLTGHSAARFLLTGAGGAMLLFALMLAFSKAGVAPFAASAIAYVLSFATVYSIHRSWTFPGRASHRHALPRYLIIQLVAALFSGFVAQALVVRFGFDPVAMAACTTIAASIFSYFASSLWAFAAPAS
ncbi:MAG: GtrA family protein [Notoacmeibacter sp.]|nr:GtrA family protein [Notoacmeibacter sp.]MCC0031633.1 GtrA family protein [Brucellaceae bacterium]